MTTILIVFGLALFFVGAAIVAERKKKTSGRKKALKQAAIARDNERFSKAMPQALQKRRAAHTPILETPSPGHLAFSGVEPCAVCWDPFIDMEPHPVPSFGGSGEFAGGGAGRTWDTTSVSSSDSSDYDSGGDSGGGDD